RNTAPTCPARCTGSWTGSSGGPRRCPTTRRRTREERRGAMRRHEAIEAPDILLDLGLGRQAYHLEEGRAFRLSVGPAEARFRCPSCKGIFRCGQADGHARVACPQCGAVVRLPASGCGPAWYIARGRETFGPFTLPELAWLAGGGRVLPTDMACQA